MSEKKIIDAVGHLDDDLIEEVDFLRKKSERRLPFSRLSLVAACLLVLLLCTVLTLPTLNHVSGVTGENDREDQGIPSIPAGGAESGVVTESQSNGKLEESDSSDDAVDVEGTVDMSTIPIFVTITKIDEDSFECTVESSTDRNFKNGTVLTVSIATDADVPRGLSEGDSVFVVYSVIDGDDENITAHKVYYNEGETTPALF